MNVGARFLLIAFAMSCLTGPAFAEGASGSSRPLILKRAVVALKEGQVWGKWGHAFYCDIAPIDLTWRSAPSALDTDRLAEVFNEELARADLNGAESNNLFEDRATSGGLQVGALVKDMQAKICSRSANGVASTRSFRGSVEMTVEWQVYDPVRHEVVARLQTVAHGEHGERTRDGFEAIMVDGFRNNVRALLQRQELRALANGAPQSVSEGSDAMREPQISLAVSAPTGAMPLSDAIGSVVLVQTDDMFGSGFLVSNDGYLLTNAHVVSGAKVVRIRWSDGFSAPGDVVRVNKKRDVALIKTSPHSRPPLALRPGLAQTGEATYAIGAPLDQQFQGTVTRGVVSATRIYDGLSYVQSDVTVNHGNSGGPLLDEKGRVIAITDLGYQPEGLPTGINLFIPIGDALDFLNLKPAPQAAP